MSRSESLTYREPAPTKPRKANPFLGIAKKSEEDREALDNLLATIVAELNEAITEDLGHIAALNIADDVLTITSSKSGLSTALKLPISAGSSGYWIDNQRADRPHIETYLSNQLTCGKILDVLVRIKRGA